MSFSLKIRLILLVCLPWFFLGCTSNFCFSCARKCPIMATTTITTEDLGKSCLEEPRWWAPQMQLPDGRIIVAGGNVPDPVLIPGSERPIDSIEIVNPQTCSSTVLPEKLDTPRAGTTAVMTGGQVLFFGGGSATSIQAYSERDGLRTVGQMQAPRSGSAHATLPYGRVWTTGGYSKIPRDKTILATTEIFDVTTGSTTAGPNLDIARAGHSATALPNGQILIIGGKNETATHATAELYNPQNGSLTTIESTLAVARKDHRAVLDDQGRVWILGGTQASGHSTNVVEYFNTSDQRFYVAKSADGEPLLLSQAREDLEALFIPELGVIVAAGGEQKGEPGDPLSNAIDVVNVKEMSVTSTISLYPRDEPTLAVQNVDAATGTASLVFIQSMNVLPNKYKLTPNAEKITVTVTQ